MDKGLIPGRYAKALLKFADDKNASKRVYDLMLNIARAFEQNHDLQTAIANPFVSTDRKIELLDTAAGTDNDPIITDLVKLLVKNNRVDITRSVALQYIALYRRQNNIYHVDITSAAPLDDNNRKRLHDIVAAHLDKNAVAEYTFDINPALIGGFVINIDNQLLDASVQNQLKKLRQNLIK